MYQSPVADVIAAKLIIAQEHDVKVEFIEYTTTQDNSEFGLSDLLYFNIVDPSHESYKGTFAVKVEELHGKAQQKQQGQNAGLG